MQARSQGTDPDVGRPIRGTSAAVNADEGGEYGICKHLSAIYLTACITHLVVVGLWGPHFNSEVHCFLVARARPDPAFPCASPHSLAQSARHARLGHRLPYPYDAFISLSAPHSAPHIPLILSLSRPRVPGAPPRRDTFPRNLPRRPPFSNFPSITACLLPVQLRPLVYTSISLVPP